MLNGRKSDVALAFISFKIYFSDIPQQKKNENGPNFNNHKQIHLLKKQKEIKSEKKYLPFSLIV